MKLLSLIIVFLGVVSCAESQKTNVQDATSYGDSFLIDVRTSGEYIQGSPEGAVNIPVDDLTNRLQDLPSDKDTKIVVFCLSGGRSSHAKVILEDHGYVNVINGGTYRMVQNKLAQESAQKPTKG